MRTALGLFAVAIGAVAQTAVTSAPQIVVRSGAIGGIITTIDGNFSLQAVVGHPYSADQVSEHVQTLADGTHITQTMQQTTKLYRDSAGRTRTEHVFTPPPGAAMAVAPSFIQIADPVAGYRYMLDPRTQTARRSAFAPAIPRPNMLVTGKPVTPAVLPAVRPRPDRSRESLGTQTIEGVLAEGMRFTTTLPEGSVGNDRPITTISENWTSPDLKILVLSKSSDPRSGEHTMRLTNIVTAEPDPALFQVPADYSIVDEPAPVVR